MADSWRRTMLSASEPGTVRVMTATRPITPFSTWSTSTWTGRRIQPR